MPAFVRLYPLFARLRGRLGLPNGLHAAAARSWELAPAVESMAPRALFDEHEVSKITGGSPDRSVEGELRPVYGGVQRHAPTIAHELHDVLIAEGHLFTRRAFIPVGLRKAPVVAQAPRHEAQSGVLTSSAYGVKYFGHWMSDDLPRILAADDLGPPISVLDRPTPGQRQYLELLGLKPQVHVSAFFKRLIVIEDHGQNDYRRERYLRLRSLAEAAVPTPRRPAGVMLLRGGSGGRRVLANEAEVADLVRARGFVVLDPAVATAHELVQACLDADIVIGVEGSQLSNGVMWMSRTGTLLVLQPPQRFVSVHKDQCDNLGVRYAFVVCDPRADDGFHVDLAAVGRMLDRIAHQPAH